MSAKAEHYDVIRKPVITEKSTMASENGAVVFEVAIDSNKPQIKEAVVNSENVGLMLEEISTQAHSISDANLTIASASEQQSQVTEDIAQRLKITSKGLILHDIASEIISVPTTLG